MLGRVIVRKRTRAQRGRREGRCAIRDRFALGEHGGELARAVRRRQRSLERGHHDECETTDQLRVLQTLALREIRDQATCLSPGKNAAKRADAKVQPPAKFFARQMRQDSLKRAEESSATSA